MSNCFCILPVSLELMAVKSTDGCIEGKPVFTNAEKTHKKCLFKNNFLVYEKCEGLKFRRCAHQARCSIWRNASLDRSLLLAVWSFLWWTISEFLLLLSYAWWLSYRSWHVWSHCPGTTKKKNPASSKFRLIQTWRLVLSAFRILPWMRTD